MKLIPPSSAINIFIALQLFSLTFIAPIFAQETKENSTANSNTGKTKDNFSSTDAVFELGEMVVTASPSGQLRSRDILSSVDIMNADKIANQNVLTAFDLLHRMPGIQITQFNQGITTGKFSFRGFNGEGNINAVKLLIDGIPSNINSGDMPFIDALFPLDIESIETVRGTNDPRYGLHAIAGNANIHTTEGGSYLKGRTSYGSFDTWDIQTGAGYEKNGFTQNYTVNYRETNSYRANAGSDKNSFSGKWFYSPENGKYKVGLIARYSEAEAIEPGYLTPSELRVDRGQSRPHNATDGGNRELGQLSAHFDVNLTDDLFWSTKSYVNTFDDQRWVTFSAQQNQQERLTNEVQYGATTALTWRPKVDFLDDFSTEIGFDIQEQENKSRRWFTANRLRTDAPTRDQDFNFYTYGGYVQTMIQPAKWLRLTPGFRVDKIGGDFFTEKKDPANPVNNTVNDYGAIWQPKVGAVITPIEGYSLYGNWGRTFQVGLGAGTFTVPGTASFAPSINDGWEIGVKLAPVDWAESRIAYWQQTASGELGRDFVTNDFTNIGSTKRQGVDVQVKVKPIEPMNIWAAYSIQKAVVKTASSGSKYEVGNQIFNTPDYVFSAGVDYQITPELKSSLWTTGQGDYYTNELNDKGQFGEYALLNLDLAYRVNKLVELQFQIKNLTDTNWEYVWFNSSAGSNGSNMFSPGDGRAFYGSIAVNYDLL